MEVAHFIFLMNASYMSSFRFFPFPAFLSSISRKLIPLALKRNRPYKIITADWSGHVNEETETISKEVLATNRGTEHGLLLL